VGLYVLIFIHQQLDYSSDKIRRWAGHVARAEGGPWWGNLRKRDHLEDPDVDGWIILRWMFRKWVVGVWTG
jgi:hypothetical protein